MKPNTRVHTTRLAQTQTNPMTDDDGVRTMMMLLLTISLQRSPKHRTTHTDTLDKICRSHGCTCCFWVLEHTHTHEHIPVVRMGAFTRCASACIGRRRAVSCRRTSSVASSSLFPLLFSFVPCIFGPSEIRKPFSISCANEPKTTPDLCVYEWKFEIKLCV